MADGRATATDSAALHQTERLIALILGVAAIVHVVIGLLRGFGFFEWGAVTAEVAPDFSAAMLWLLPAVAASILAATMAGSQHHRPMRSDAEGWSMHIASYIFGAGTIALGALALLVGYDLLGMGTTVLDGLLWGMAAIVGGLITWALHASIPSALTDQDYLVSLVETRVRAGGPAPQTQAGPAPEVEA